MSLNQEILTVKAASMKGATVTYKLEWDALTFLVHDKLFGMIAVENKTQRSIITLKVDPIDGQHYLLAYEGIMVPGYYMNKKLWVSVYLDTDCDESLVLEMIEKSYHLVVSKLPKKIQANYI